MAVPTTCDITFPSDGWTAGAAPVGTATIGCDCTTDPATPVQFKLNGSNVGAPVTSDVDGLAEKDIAFPIGTNTLLCVAGTAPDTLESDPVTVIVQDVIAAIKTADSRSVRWYLNWLAGNTVTTIPESFLPPIRQAACQWAGVSPQQYGTKGALSIKAGITQPYQFVSQNTALNFIAYDTTNPDECTTWLTDQQALLKICQEA